MKKKQPLLSILILSVLPRYESLQKLVGKLQKQILFNDLPSQWREIKDKCSPAIEQLLESGAYIGGQALESFENSFSAYTGKKYAAGISNVTDALKLAVQAFEFYDTTTNVIIPANTYIADALAVAHQPKGNFKITLIDCDEFFQLDLKATEEHLISSRERTFPYFLIIRMEAFAIA